MPIRHQPEVWFIVQQAGIKKASRIAQLNFIVE
jgi:hypothetical protein